MKCTDLLTRDHKVILRGLYVLDAMAGCFERGEAVDRDDIEILLRFMRAFADDYHQLKEESALFPELLRCAGAQEGPLHQMLFEHEQERSLVTALEDSLYTDHRDDFVYYADRLIALIHSHIHKEDNILFDIADRTLSAEQDERVVSELNKFCIDAKYEADLHRLEWKYLRRAA